MPMIAAKILHPILDQFVQFECDNEPKFPSYISTRMPLISGAIIHVIHTQGSLCCAFFIRGMLFINEEYIEYYKLR